MNSVEAEWRSVLADQLNGNMFMDTPKGKTAFACGVGFVLGQLWDRADRREMRMTELRSELEEFVEAYMAISANQGDRQ